MSEDDIYTYIIGTNTSMTSYPQKRERERGGESMGKRKKKSLPLEITSKIVLDVYKLFICVFWSNFHLKNSALVRNTF